ncbi:MAG: glycoside hydrolase [Anaerolineae bacterium]|nr:glycoside hydrolase [Anaerolineae bacterium]
MVNSVASAQGRQPPQPSKQGAFATGKYRNVLAEYGLTQEEIQKRIDATWQQLFYGNDSTERIYYPVGDDMAYIIDVNNNDIRSEGMSYGMMIAVQLDKQEEFNRLWKWVKTYMYQHSGVYEGYFAWHNRPDGTAIDRNPASDGETWFVMTLFFAANRWGNGEGIFNYQAEANSILHTMLHRSERGGSATSMFDPEHKMVVFVPTRGDVSEFTDPSYHTPHFYELWARWADQDKDFWAEAAKISRDFWHTTAHPETGLMPDYADFDGKPREFTDYGPVFYADAWRCAMLIALDYEWFAADPWQIEQTDRLQAFFHKLGIGRYNTRFQIDGTPSNPQHRSTALVAANAAASLAASDVQAWDFIKEFWNTSLTTGQYRYYDGLLYMWALLQLSGNFRIYAPQ